MNRTPKYRGRIKRLNVSEKRPDAGPSFLHCMSRTVAGAHLFGVAEKEMFRRMMRQQADFCGITILTYAVMNNHFHLLVRVDPPRALSDEELVDRVRHLSSERKAHLIRRWLADRVEGPKVRERLLKRMHDVSFFLKELKQRFTLWFNRKHDRFGTLWAEKFKSVLVEGDPEVLIKVAGYVDLNPLRAGLCRDPRDYRFCGYGEAVGGGGEAREGIGLLYRKKDWQSTQRAYRLLLFGKGNLTARDRGRISDSALRKVIEEKGSLSLADALRCRVRYFSDGLAIGSAEFIEAVFRERKASYWSKRRKGAHPLPAVEWSGLCALSRLAERKSGSSSSPL